MYTLCNAVLVLKSLSQVMAKIASAPNKDIGEANMTECVLSFSNCVLL